ncbi:hypothetical protein GCM10027592_53470 [Spirosoma flavus]
MDWQTIKDKVYQCDGSLRDLYVLNTTQEDWQKWFRLINESYSVEFYDGQTERVETIIDSDLAIEYLDGKIDSLVSATIKLGAVIVKCYFFADQEIENDIDPREVTSIDDHIRLVDYIIAVSKCLNKPVIQTEENSQDMILIIADNDNVSVNC